jgi:sugar lactone lactonase YvrE
MKIPIPARILPLLGLCLGICAPLAQAQYTNGQNAYGLWGQEDFTTLADPIVVDNGTFTTPTDFTVDSATGKLYVADSANNRVLRFASGQEYFAGAGAEVVFGQDDFSENGDGTSSSALSNPTAVTVDSRGILWVADTGNNRVVGFQGAATDDNGASADYVLGQLDFTFSTASTTQSGLNNPTGVAVDTSGNLYVVDQGNSRILKFSSPNTAPNNIAKNATGLLGQSNFLNATPGISAQKLDHPTSAKIDSSGNLWVSDTGNNRVVFFPSITSQPVNGSATKVVGQPNLTSNTPAVTQIGLTGPTGIAFDVLGRLYISDSAANRVLAYGIASDLPSNGANAQFVLGQPNFTSSAPTPVNAPNQNGLSTPRGIEFLDSSLQLWVTDSVNNRAISYVLTPGTPAFSVPALPKLSTTKKKTISFSFLNSGTASDEFTLGVTIPKATKQVATLKFLIGGVDVTSALTSGTYDTGFLTAGQTVLISVKVTPKSKATQKGAKVTFTMFGASVTLPSDTVQQTVTAKFKKPKN